METSEAFEAFVSRYHSYLDDEWRDARYRPEFLDAMYHRARGLEAERPGSASFADDYDPYSGSYDVLCETGGCTWTCQEHGTSSPNRPVCDCPVPDFGNLWRRGADAEREEATAAWVAAWEAANGSRFLPEEEVLASLRREVWRRRRVRREVRKTSRGWFRKLRRSWGRPSHAE